MEKGLYAVILVLAVLPCMVYSQSCDAYQTSEGGDGKIWTIATGHDWGAYEYFDDQGYISGFSSEIITAVCAAAGIDCRIIWDKYVNCWDSAAGTHPTPGKGLMGQWYDACTGWGVTIERMHAFDFTLPYLAAPSSYLYVPAGDDLNINDLAGKKIAFFDGWYSDEKCLARQGNENRRNYVLTGDQIIHVPGPTDVIELFNNNEADAVFAGEQDMTAHVDSGIVRKINVPFSCVLGGHGMMTRKDSEFATHWNRGFQKIRSNGQFHKICQAGGEAHSDKGVVNCVE